MLRNTHTPNGFTLIELAIALMVIGLLIGGVLKGQELIENARHTQTIRQVKSYDAAIKIFRSTYSEMPGDLENPGTRLPNCTTTICNTPDYGNGIYSNHPTDIQVMPRTPSINQIATSKPRRAWVHLAKAGLITGVDADYEGSYSGKAGVELPETAYGSHAVIGVHVVTSTNWGDPIQRNNYYVIRLTDPTVNIGYALTSAQAMTIDLKADDGKPGSGSVRVGALDDGPYVPSSNCVSGTTYMTGGGTRACNLYIQME